VFDLVEITVWHADKLPTVVKIQWESELYIKNKLKDYGLKTSQSQIPANE
jgi:hypothetical protein